MDQALNYFDHFKEGLFMYRKDVRYPIDNNLVERQVRPFTALRKAIQHHGSDAGAEMATVYLSVVST
ncbi:MAG: transposase [Prevotella sp.]|nr:transposase [Prevotella sp.]